MRNALVVLRAVALPAFAALAVPAGAINVCTDASGRAIYQDQACQNVAPVAATEPVAAQALTAAGVRETVRRFQAAQTARDAATASRFLAPGFQATLHEGARVGRYSRDGFQALLAEALNAATAYEASARCGAVEVQGAAATVQCETAERRVLPQRTESGSATERYRLVLNAGRIQFASVESQRH